MASCTGCEKLIDATTLLANVGRFTSLINLKMEFGSIYGGCPYLQGIDALGESLEQLKSLQTLQLDFSYCQSISGIVLGLGQGLQALHELCVLVLDLSNTSVSDVPDLGKAFSSLTKLEVCRVSFQFCAELTAQAGLQIASGMVQPFVLHKVAQSEEYLGRHIQGEGGHFNLCFNGCVRLPDWLAMEDEGGFSHPTMLREVLRLHISRCGH